MNNHLRQVIEELVEQQTKQIIGRLEERFEQKMDQPVEKIKGLEHQMETLKSDDDILGIQADLNSYRVKYFTDFNCQASLLVAGGSSNSL